MKSLRIEGLRSLKDSGFIPINPLTIFLGENSSGKSTFLRSFPLLRQSIESITRGPILWYGSYVDFGLFEDALSKFSDDKTISFSFKLDSDEISDSFPKRYSRSAGIKNGDIIAKLSLISDTKEKSTRVLSVEISNNSNFAKATYNRSGKIIKFISNGIDVTD